MIFSKQKLAIRSTVIALFVAVLFMIIDTQKPELTLPIREKVHAAMSPIYAVAETSRFSKEKVKTTLTSKNSIIRENQALKAKLAQANVFLQKYASLSAENAQLRGLLEYPTPVDGRVEIVSVIGIDNNPLRQILVLNRGKKHGVYVGQTLLDQSGVMGQVINVYGTSSRAMLLSDGDHSISVKIERTGVRAVVTGNGDNGSLDLQYVPNTSDLQVGDQIVTSGLGQRFPAGYSVGVVSHIDRVNKHEFIKAKVKPSAKLTADNYVMLLYPNQKIEMQVPDDYFENLEKERLAKVEAQNKLNKQLAKDPAKAKQVPQEELADTRADHQSNTKAINKATKQVQKNTKNLQSSPQVNQTQE